MAAIEATWDTDGQRGRLEENGEVRGFIQLVSDWYEAGARTPSVAWVIDWMAAGHDAMQRGLIELDGTPATSSDERARIAERAMQVIHAGPPPTPAQFGAMEAGLLTRAGVKDLVELSSHSLQEAVARVFRAARREDEYAVLNINTGLLEVVGWTRALDELMQRVWDHWLTPAVREQASLDVDATLTRPSISRGVVAEVGAARRIGHPYPSWTHALVAKGVWLPPAELRAFRWLAGKLLHHGPLSVVELRHWRAGEQPRWKWRAADSIYPRPLPEEREGQRTVYDQLLAGRDVVGSLLPVEALIEMEHLFFGLLRDSEAEERAAGP
jgi:hypothetical protein